MKVPILLTNFFFDFRISKNSLASTNYLDDWKGFAEGEAEQRNSTSFIFLERTSAKTTGYEHGIDNSIAFFSPFGLAIISSPLSNAFYFYEWNREYLHTYAYTHIKSSCPSISVWLVLAPTIGHLSLSLSLSWWVIFFSLLSRSDLSALMTLFCSTCSRTWMSWIFFFCFWRNNFLTIPVITARRVVKNKIVNLSKIYSCQCIKVGFSLSSLSVSTSILGECRISSAKNFS